ncbi:MULTISPECIES: flagellar hook-associated protein FlgL [unclassified Escherichia]|uniref:flagellar hook-associated protein FlgL n=1 Tax=unclassified Escherichia TaxID=2608889 RepID=UPI001080B6EC|nr:MULTISPECIES: flagellar hook-associated protein FlgL [unclassified Escherichia]TGB80883.1 flagellar hook-associated protein 3 [Escherichia sp. E4694]TLJ03229.1 flagellar hook-associated protein 3 [Escherichia sp. E4385]
MRLSTSFLYQRQLDSMSKAMSNYNDISERLASGQSLLKPSDDPNKASQALSYQNQLSRIDEFGTARTYAQDALGQEDTKLTSISGILTDDLAGKIVQAGSETYSKADREALATELAGIRSRLIDLGNSKNSDGQYMFAGYKTGSAPFKDDGTYVGGTTAMTQNVSDSAKMDVSTTGNELFPTDAATGNNLMQSLQKTIDALNNLPENPTDAERKTFEATLAQTNTDVHKAIDNIGKIQAGVGSSLQQLETLGSSADTQAITIESRLEESTGADMGSMSDMITKSKMAEFALNSSMSVFQTMQQLSIFKMFA